MVHILLTASKCYHNAEDGHKDKLVVEVISCTFLSKDGLGIVVILGIAMLFIRGDFVMRILSKRQLKELVLYSPQHIARLEKAVNSPSGYS